MVGATLENQAAVGDDGPTCAQRGMADFTSRQECRESLVAVQAAGASWLAGEDLALSGATSAWHATADLNSKSVVYGCGRETSGGKPKFTWNSNTEGVKGSATHHAVCKTAVGTECKACGSGKFASFSGPTRTPVDPGACQAHSAPSCAANEVTAAGTASADAQCVACGLGQDVVANTCIDCSAGKHGNSGAGVCVACAPGKYTDQTAQTAASACSLCPAGREPNGGV